MRCLHPLKGWIIGKTKDGKDQYKITSYDVNHIELIGNTWQSIFTSNLAYHRLDRLSTDYAKYNYKVIPCGKCIGCKLNKAQQWANRCLLEAQYHDSNYFITLTYDESHVPLHPVFDKDTGAYIASQSTLRKTDIQKFIKRLRKNTGQDIRYFLCGEYGTMSHRPHYHLIVFGLQLDDLKPLSQNANHDWFYTSDMISKCWKFGFHSISDVNYETANYTAKYCLKKATSTEVLSDILGIEPEFILASKRPAIGRRFYDENKDHLFDKADIAIVPLRDGSHRIRSIQYFEKLYDIDYPEASAERKLKRLQSSHFNSKLELSQTDKNELDYLKSKADSYERQFNSSSRTLKGVQI